MNIESLIANQRAAHAAWLACPDKRRAEKAALEAALSAAARAVAEAKRAAAPAPAPVADIDGAIAAAASRQRAVDLVARVRRAARLPISHASSGDAMNTALHFDLTAQRAASMARMEDMRLRIAESTGDDRTLWESMLRQYEQAMPHLDAQISYVALRDNRSPTAQG